jgi:DNA-binding MarR family transcriptional regulator
MEHDVEARILGTFSSIVRRSRALEITGPAGAVPASVIPVLGLLGDGGEPRLGAVAAALGLDTSVVSRTVAAAASLGLVARRPDPRDGRACLLSLTPRGAACLADRRHHRLQLLGSVLEGWEPGSAEALLAGLTRLRDGLARLSPPPAGHRDGALPTDTPSPATAAADPAKDTL